MIDFKTKLREERGSFIVGPINTFSGDIESVSFQPDSGDLISFSSGSALLNLSSPVLETVGDDNTGTISLTHKAEVDHGDAGSTETINFADGPAHYFNVSAECTLTLSNPQDGGAYVILIEANGTHEVLWPAVTWLTPGGVAPDISALSDGDLCIVNLYRSGTKAAYIGTYAVVT